MVEEQAMDKHSEAPSDEGQVEESPQSEQSLEDKIAGSFSGEEQTVDNEQVEQQTEEVQTEEQPQQEKIVVDGQEFNSIDDFKKSYKEARKKISQKTEAEKAGEKFQEFFQNNPEAQKVLQAYSQNPEVAKVAEQFTQNQELKTLYQAYENGLINKDQLQQVNQYLQNENKNTNRKPNENTNLPTNQEDLKQFIQKQVQQGVQQISTVQQAKNQMENEYQQLSNEYGDTLNEMDLDFESLGEYAIQNQYTNEQGIPSMKKALNHYIADNEDMFSMMQRLAKNDVQKETQEKKKAQVESSNVKQQSSGKKSPEQRLTQYITEADTTGGGLG